MNKKHSINGIDQILQLPDHLVDHIFSFLPLADAVRTSVLSKRWKNLWITAIPKLLFDIDFFNYGWLSLFRECDDDIRANTRRMKLLNFIERTLRLRHSQNVSIQKLDLHFPVYLSEVANTLDLCIRYAMGCNVKELDLDISFREDGLYDLSRIVLAAKSLTNLSLKKCKLEFSSCINMNFFSALKILSLESVTVNHQILQNLLAFCPVIEKLKLFLDGPSNRVLKISGIVNPKLVELIIGTCKFERVEIQALGLKCLHIGSILKITPTEINVSTCKNLRSLYLCGVTITDKWFHDMISKLCLLEKLSLDYCDMLESIKISSCRIDDLNVRMCTRLLKVEIDVPNLRRFNYVGTNVISFSSNSLALWRARISLKPTAPDDPHWYTKLTEFLGKFNNSKLFILSVKDVIVPKEFRESLTPPLYNVKCLTLELDQELLDQSVEETVDGLLWLCPHPEFLSIALHNGKTLELKFYYEEVDRERYACYCSSLPITCWRHCLKDVDVWPKGETERKIKSFFEPYTRRY